MGNFLVEFMIVYEYDYYRMAFMEMRNITGHQSEKVFKHTCQPFRAGSVAKLSSTMKN